MVLFPVTYTTNNGRTKVDFMDVAVGFEPQPEHDYSSVVLGLQLIGPCVLHFSDVVRSEMNILMAMVCAVVACDRTQSIYGIGWQGDMYITVEDKLNRIDKGSVCGSSMGLAVYVGIMAAIKQMNVPNTIAFTGMVSPGLSDAVAVVCPIDEAGRKAVGAAQKGITLFVPHANATDLSSTVSVWSQTKYVDYMRHSDNRAELPAVVLVQNPACLELLFE